MSNVRDADDRRPHQVYRCYDDANQLVYVGCTGDLDYRMSLAHPLVARETVLVETEDFPNRSTARVAERAAIEAEAPLLNKQHNPTRFTGRAGGGFVAVDPIHPLTAELVRHDEPVTMDQKREALEKVATLLGLGEPA